MRFKNGSDKKKAILDCISPQGSTVREILECLKRKGYKSRNLTVQHLSKFMYYHMYNLKKKKMRGKGGTYIYFKG